MKNDIKPDDYLNSVKAFFILLDSYKEYPNECDILIKHFRSLRKILVAGKNNASRLLQPYSVNQLEEQKRLLPVELAVSHLIDDKAGILGKSVQ